MSEVNNIPRLRFPSFYDEWKHDKLGNVINFQNGVGHERSIDENGNVVVVNSKFISTEGTVRKYTDKVLSIIPDDSLCMVMSDVPNGKAIAKCYYFETGNHFSLNQRICSIKSETEVNKFLFYRINRHKYYLKFDNGVGQTNLRKSEVLNCPIKLPSLSEQQKIADFLTAVDKRIELLEKKKTLLETYKKGVIKKIFNQEIRFKDDNGNDFPDWELFKLNDVLFEHKQKNNESKFEEVFSVSKQKGVVNQIEHLGRSYSAETIDHYKLIDNWDIVYTKSPTSDFPFGIIKQNTTGRTGVLSPLYGVFRPKNKWIGKMIASYFESWVNTYNYLIPLVQKGAKNTMNINNDTFLNGKQIKLPTSECEQEKISNFLFSIEDQLELLETQIDKSKTWKKGLLQKMFV